MERSKFHLSQPAELVVALENVAERAADKISGFRTRVEWELVRLVAEAEWSQVIQTQDMIGVTVSEEHSVKLANMLADRLFAKVGRGIDKHGSSCELHQN
jgi:hypothetical protein